MYQSKSVYAVSKNLGDGSARIDLYASKALATWIEENDEESFGEPTIIEIVVESDGWIVVKGVKTAFEVLLGLVEDEEPQEEFRSMFFPCEVPPFELRDSEPINWYRFVDVLFNGKVVKSIWVSKEKTLDDIENDIRG